MLLSLAQKINRAKVTYVNLTYFFMSFYFRLVDTVQGTHYYQYAARTWYKTFRMSLNWGFWIYDHILWWWRPIYRFTIISTVVIASFGIGYMMPTFENKSLMGKLPFQELFLVVPVGMLALLAWDKFGQPDKDGKSSYFEYGILAMVGAACAFRFRLPTGSESPLVMSLIIALGLIGLWMAQMILMDKQFYVKSSPINIPAFIFITIAITSYIWSLSFRDVLVSVRKSFVVVQLASLIVIVGLPFMTLLISNKIENVKWIRWMVGILLTASVVAVFGRITKNTLLTHSISRKPFILAIHDRGLFACWVVAICYGMVLYNENLKWKQRLFFLALMGGWIYYTFFMAQSWASGWMPWLFACVILTFRRSKIMFFTAVFGAILFLTLNFSFVEEMLASEEEEGAGERQELWSLSFGHIKNHPFFGMGPAGYAAYYMAYHPHNARSTHNNYFDIAAQHGVMGLVAFLWLVYAIQKTNQETARNVKGQRNFEEAFANASIAAGYAALLAGMLGDWIFPFAYNETIAGFDNAIYTWAFWGAAIALHHITEKRKVEGISQSQIKLSDESFASITA